MVSAERVENAEEFLALTRAFLSQRELVCGLKLGLGQLLAARPGACPDAYFAVLRRGAEICGCALQTPPRNLVISELDAEGAEALAACLARDQIRFPAVHGPVRAAALFAEAWARRQALVARTQVRLRLFRLEHVAPRPPVSGSMRPARPRDETLVVRWFQAFHREAIPNDPVDPASVAWRALENGKVFVWEDRGPVAMAALGRELASSATIGPVYTPPERRGSGYATALVSALSQYVLDRGKRYACLFTDLSNPVSNSIYPKIGYEPVSDYREIAFERPR